MKKSFLFSIALAMALTTPQVSRTGFLQKFIGITTTSLLTGGITAIFLSRTVQNILGQNNEPLGMQDLHVLKDIFNQAKDIAAGQRFLDAINGTNKNNPALTVLKNIIAGGGGLCATVATWVVLYRIFAAEDKIGEVKKKVEDLGGEMKQEFTDVKKKLEEQKKILQNDIVELIKETDKNQNKSYEELKKQLEEKVKNIDDHLKKLEEANKKNQEELKEEIKNVKTGVIEENKKLLEEFDKKLESWKKEEKEQLKKIESKIDLQCNKILAIERILGGLDQKVSNVLIGPIFGKNSTQLVLKKQNEVNFDSNLSTPKSSVGNKKFAINAKNLTSNFNNSGFTPQNNLTIKQVTEKI